MSVRIVVVQGPELGKSFEIVKDLQYTIGRGEEANIQIVDDLVSRIHLVVRFDGQRVTIIDQGSTNKTFVGQKPIPPKQPISLASDTRFSLGPEVFLEIQFGESQPAQSHVQAQQPVTPPISQNPFAASIIQNPPARSRPAPPPQEPSRPAPPSAPATAGNFSGSIRPDAQLDHDVSDESSNIFGAYSKNRGIMENAPRNQSKPQPRPETTPEPSQDAGYLGNSIAPPGEIGSNNSRPSFEADDDIFPAYKEASSPTPTPKPPTAPPPVDPPEQKVAPSPSAQRNDSFASDSYEADPIEADSYATDSIAPPGLQGGQFASRPPIAPIENFDQAGGLGESIEADHRRTPNSDQIASTNLPTSDTSAPVASPAPNFAGSIAFPGSTSEEPQLMSPTDYQGSIARPGDLHVRRQPETKPSRIDPSPVISSNFTSLVWVNGLHVLTGQNPEDSASDFVATMRSKFALVFCVDWSKVTPEESKDDDALESPNRIRGGIPIFNDPNGPSLHQGDAFQLDVQKLWGQDAIIIFGGQDVSRMLEHLQRLSKVNIQTGEVSEDQFFGFCWPSVLKAVLSGQNNTSVGRVFGQDISGILLEDPDQECGWSMISQAELAGHLS